MLKAKRVVVTNPEWDAELAKLRAEQETAHSEMEEAAREWAQCRARLDAAQTAQSFSAPGSDANTQARKTAAELARRIDAAAERRQQAKATLRRITQEMPLVRGRIARRIAAEVAPTFNQAAGAFVKARLERLGPEIVAAATVDRLNQEAAARRVTRVGWAQIAVTAAVREHQDLKADVEAALAVGAVKKSDIPREVQQAWGL